MKTVASRFIIRPLSQYLNYKAAESEYKNLLLNGVQMTCMMSGELDLDKDNITKELMMPVLWGTSTMMDDFLIQKGILSKHIFSDLLSTFNVADAFSHFLPSGLGYLFAGGLLGIKYIQEYLSGDKGFINTTRELQLKMNKSMKQLEYVTDGTVNPKVAICTQVLTNTIIDNVFIGLSPNVQHYKKMLQTFVALGIGGLFSLIGIESINERNSNIIQSPNALLKIASSREHANTLNIIDEISNDCTEVLSNTVMFNSVLMRMNDIFTNSPISFSIMNLRSLIGILYNQSNQLGLYESLKSLTSASMKSKSSLINNPRTIIERDGLEYYEYKDSEYQQKIIEMQNNIQEKDMKKLFVCIATISEAALQTILSVLLTSRDLALNSEAHIINGTIKLSNTTEFLTDIMNLSQTESSMPSLNRLTALYKFLDSIENTSYVHYHSHNSHGMYLKDIDVNINGVNKLHIKDMCLESGKWYLLSGKSGCGKSTLMSTLRGLPNFTDAITIEGEIFYPKINEKPQIYMLTQANNFPYMTTMMEAILYPMITTDIERASYKNLVEELMLKMEGLTRDSKAGKEYLENGLLSRLFETVNDITSETSGGQQKKMSITGMIVRIMKETGMLNIYYDDVKNGASHDTAMQHARDSVGSVLVLIDETFNGLDSGAIGGNFINSSKGLVFKTLKESLPTKAIVVSVEHQPDIKQYDGHIHLNGDGSYTATNESFLEFPVDYEDFQPFDL